VKHGKLLAAVRLSILVQSRAYFVHAYAAVAIATVIVVRFLIPVEWHKVVVPAVLLGEFGTMAVFLVAGQRYFERNQGMVGALLVTPIRRVELVASMILAPALITTVAGLAVHAGVFGLDRRLFWLVLPLAELTILSGAIGLILAVRFSEFTQFLMGSLPVVTMFSLPLLSFFDLVPRIAFVWLPWDAALFSFSEIASGETRLLPYAAKVAELTLFTALGCAWASRAFRGRIDEQGDLA
jgi:fluoroquinolone transport system permease protein